MSHELAIAAVTAVIAELLTTPVDDAVTGARVLHLRPDEGDRAKANVNLYAYGVRRNAALANDDLPTRRANGILVAVPTLALDIHYLLTFYGSDAKLEPQRLLAAAVTALHAWPVLDPKFIRDTIATVTDADNNPYLADSDVADQLERIRITPIALDLEAMSKLWSVFFQTAYSLSVAYQASVVLLQPHGPTPQPALPVTRRSIQAVPFHHPHLAAAVSAAGRLEPITSSDTLVLSGSGLRADHVQVRIGDVVAIPSNPHDDEIRVDLSTLSGLVAGPTGVQVVHLLAREGGGTYDFGFESDTQVILLRPTMALPSESDKQPTATRIFLDLTPQVLPRQRVRLFLNQGLQRFVFPALPRTVAATRVEFPISGVPAGTYLMRVSVDGADSPVARDSSQAPIGPTIAVPA